MQTGGSPLFAKLDEGAVLRKAQKTPPGVDVVLQIVKPLTLVGAMGHAAEHIRARAAPLLPKPQLGPSRRAGAARDESGGDGEDRSCPKRHHEADHEGRDDLCGRKGRDGGAEVPPPCGDHDHEGDLHEQGESPSCASQRVQVNSRRLAQFLPLRS